MVDVTTSIVIDRPIREVFAYTIDPDKAPEWYQNIKSADWKTPRPLALGTKVAFVARFLGRTLAYVYEVVELVPEKKFVMRTAEGPFPMETSYMFERVGDAGTEMFLRNRGDPTGFAKLLAPFMAMAMRKANRKDLRRLKSALEH